MRRQIMIVSLIISLFSILAFAVVAADRSDVSTSLALAPTERDVRYVDTRLFDSENQLLAHDIDGAADIGDSRKDEFGATYEIAEYAGSDDTEQYQSAFALISTPTVRLTSDQMREYQRALGHSDREIDALMSPIRAPEPPSRSVISDQWLSEIREKSPDETVRAIVHFHEKIPNTYVHPLTLEPDPEEAMEIVTTARRTAKDEREAAIAEFQAPWIDEFEASGIEVVHASRLINAIEVAFPAKTVDEIAWEGAPYRLVRADMRTVDADLSDEDSFDDNPYKTLLDNRRAIGTNQYIRDGFSGRGTGSEGQIANRIKVGIMENKRFDPYHLAFRDGSSSFHRVEWLYNCTLPGSYPDTCAGGEPVDIECPGGLPNHVMASMGIIGADLENGQDASIPSAVRGHYSGIAPNASLSYFYEEDWDSKDAAYSQIDTKDIHVVSQSWGSTNNDLDPNCPDEDEWSANDILTDAVNTIIQNGTILVASAGNAAGSFLNNPRFCNTTVTGTNSIASPGNSPFVVTVGAADFLDDPRNAATTDTLWDMTKFEEVSLIKDYSSRGATYQGFRKPNIAAYVDTVHTPIVDRDAVDPVAHNRYTDTNWWLGNPWPDSCDDEYPPQPNGRWWIRAPHQPLLPAMCINPYENDDGEFDSHTCMVDREYPWDWWDQWMHESIYQERATGTSAAAPAVAGVMALVRDWILQTSNPSNAADRGRVVSTVLNFGDGMVENANLLGSGYIGYGDSTYGAGRMHARLFTNHGMDSPWRRVMEVIPELHTNDSVQFKLNQSILGTPLTIPAGVDLLKIMVYWDEPFYNGNAANIQAVLRRTVGTNCNGLYGPVAFQSSGVNQGNWLHFVFDATQTGAEANFAPLVPDRCYQLDINGLDVPNGQGGEGTRRVYVTWFYEDLKRSDNDGPCQHNPGTCSVSDANYLYFH